MTTTKLTAANHRSSSSTATLGCALINPGTVATDWKWGPPQSGLKRLPPQETSSRAARLMPSVPPRPASSNRKLPTNLPLDPHTLPKRDAILDLRRSGLRLRVVPRRVVIPHSTHFHAVVVRRSLPRTHRRVRAWFQ